MSLGLPTLPGTGSGGFMGLDPVLVEDMVHELIASADLLSDLASQVINTTSDISDIAPYALAEGRAIHSALIAAEDRYRRVAFEAASRADIIELFDISEFGDHAANAILESLMDKDLIGPTLIDHEAALRDLYEDLIAQGMDPADAAIQAGRRYAAMLIAEGLETSGVPSDVAAGLAVDGLFALTEMEANGIPIDLGIQLIVLGAAQELAPLDVAELAENNDAAHDLFNNWMAIVGMSASTGLTFDEADLMTQLAANWERLADIDVAHGNGDDDKVSRKDLQWIVDNPDDIDPLLVDLAARLLANKTLFARLDTATDESEFLDGEFGRLETDDKLISTSDIQSFLLKATLAHQLGPYADEIDTAAKGGRPDGKYSRADFEEFLNNHPELEPVVQTVLDQRLYDQSFWEANRDSIAITFAFAAGAIAVVITGGGATGIVIAAIAGGVTSAGTTAAINAGTGLDITDGLLANTITGVFAGMSGGAMTSVLTSNVGTLTKTVQTIASSSDYISMGGADLIIPANYQATVHNVTGVIGQAADLTPNPTNITKNIADTGGSTAARAASGLADDVGLSNRGFRPAPGTRIRPEGIPSNWRITETKRKGGINFGPARDKQNYVRIMQPDVRSPYPNSQVPYVRWQRHGQALDQFGMQLRDAQNAAAHIPVEDFVFRPELFQP